MATVLYMSMSLDGFVAQPDQDPGRLHEWVFPGAENGDIDAAVARLTGVNRQIYDEFMATGAVVAGRGTFEPARGWGGDHHDGVPIWILSRHAAPDWVAKMAARPLCRPTSRGDARGQGGGGRQGRARPRRGDRAAGDPRGAARRDRDPSRAGAVRRGAAAVRGAGRRAPELERVRVLEGRAGWCIAVSVRRGEARALTRRARHLSL